jgi:hypothetical protein
VTDSQTDTRARFGALLLCCVAVPTLSGCTLWNQVFHRDRPVGCSSKPFKLNTESRAALKVPEGMSAPDTRNAIRVPDLSDHPEKERPRNAPCLAEPPNYFSTPLKLNLPPKPQKPKHWWTPWRKNPPPPPPASAAPAMPQTPAVAEPSTPPAPIPAPNTSSPAPVPATPPASPPSGDSAAK